jgi:hypothetical protein
MRGRRESCIEVCLSSNFVRATVKHRRKYFAKKQEVIKYFYFRMIQLVLKCQ